ncbi:hypothetical protein G7050_00140 [Dysgonomonas sp. HDW5A]|uniref:hypothetical protein n=1 Tax=Dysgonomonas sp. HDW5A TaxID=2714926 RepID=UPI00140A0B3D|nr:hypothetical protein [Dysgonomonas sp. HDW5A]QIK58327.1 hypothetical protein G7050_00140 [Dysgonomonas sp. HDW5A]
MKKGIAIIFILLFAYSCEYQTEDTHFVEKEKPIPDKEIDINLYGVRDNDIIYIYDKTWLSYSIDEEIDRILKTEITLDGIPLENSHNGILINPDAYDNSIHKLKLYVESTSGTHSLAEKLGLERYIGEKEYTLKYIHVDRGLQITDGLSESDYLKIQWKKPNIEGLEVDRYEITYDKDWSWDSEITITISDPNQTYIIDENYVHGYKDYQIRTFFKDNKIEPWYDRYTMSYSSLAGEKIQIKTNDLENGFVSWNKNKYRCKYIFAYGVDEEGFTKTETLEYTSTSKNISLPPFPEDIYGSIYVLPENYEGNNYWTWGENFFYYYYPTFLPRDYYNRYFVTDTGNKLLYAFRGYSIAQYDVTTKEQLKTLSISYIDYHENDKLSCSSQTGKVAVLQSLTRQIHIFDKDMNQLNKFEIDENTIYTNLDDVFAITDNDMIIISGMSYSRKCMIYNIKGELLYNITAPTSPYKTKITVSDDGKYMCIYNTFDNIKIYQIKEGGAILYKNMDISNVSGCYFDPITDNELIVQESKSFYKLNLETLSKTEVIEGTYISTDPYTGYILYYDLDFKTNKKGHIRKSITDIKTYNIKLSTYYSKDLVGNTYIFNNTLVTNNPYWDISKYLK